MDTGTLMLWVLLAVLVLLYVMRRRSRMKRET